MAAPNVESPPGANRRAIDSVIGNARSETDYSPPFSPAQCFPPPEDYALLAGGVARVATFADGSFQIDPDGPTLAKLLPVEVDDMLVDMVCWEFGADRPWWLRRRVAAYLGDAELRRAIWYEKPVRLVETPQDWLAMSGLAVCVLDWRSDIRALFRDVSEVVPETPTVEGWLRRALAEQAAPTFKIRCAV